jgi:hypothetical protein
MMTYIAFLAMVLVSFVTGFLLAGWVRQGDIDALRSDLELARAREARLEETVRLAKLYRT